MTRLSSGFRKCANQHRRLGQRRAHLPKQTTHQSFCLAENPEALLQAEVLLHQASSERRSYPLDPSLIITLSFFSSIGTKAPLASNYRPAEQRRSSGRSPSNITPSSGTLHSPHQNHSLTIVLVVRLRRPEEVRKRAILPRFNSTFRYTGTYTYHQTRQLLLDRPNPDFDRSLSKRMSKSLHVRTYSDVSTSKPRPLLLSRS